MRLIFKNNGIAIIVFFTLSFILFKSNAWISTYSTHSLQPTDIVRVEATTVGTMTLRALYKKDSIYIRYYVRKENISTGYGLGNSNLVIRLDSSVFAIDKAKITKRSAWDAKWNPLDYEPLTVNFNNTSQVVSLNINQRRLLGFGVVPPTTDSLIAEVVVPVKKCVTNYSIRWSRLNPRGDVQNYQGISVYDDINFVDPQPISVCPCDASFKGLEPTYCTSSFLSKLEPLVPGGKFKGNGVKFGSGIWYFNAFEAGPGTHTIEYILPCGDTTSKNVVVEPAPCQSLSGQNATLGYVTVPNPQGIFTNCLGEIYTTSLANHSIIKIDTFANTQTITGGGIGYQDGTLAQALFSDPAGLVVSSTGVIYVADSRNQVIRKIDVANNQVTTLVGLQGSLFGTANDDGIGAGAKFSQKIIGITLDQSQTNLYITESSSGVGSINKYIFRIRRINIATRTVTTIAGGAYPSPVSPDMDNPNGLSAVFKSLSHLSVDANFLYVSDPIAKKIKKVSLVSPYSVTTILATGLDKPVTASVGPNGVIYVADQNDFTLKEINQYPSVSSAVVAGVSGDNNDSPNTFVIPNATSVFVKGFIDVADYGSGKIKRIGIKDYGSLPFKGASKNYCFDGVTDTLNYVLGSYTGNGISQINNIWVFNPITAGVGKHVIKYSFDLNACNQTFTDTFIVHPKPKPFKGADQVICNNELDKFQLDAGLGKTFQWYQGIPNQLIAGANKRFYTVPSVGSYSVVVKDTLGCNGGDTIKITSKSSSTISLGNDVPLCAGFKTVLSFSPTIGVQSVLWQGGSTSLTDTAYGGGVYHVTIRDANGCLASDTLHVISSLPPTPLISSVPAEKCLSVITTDRNAIFQPAVNSLTPVLIDMVKDSKGNTFITDYDNNRIIKLDANRVQSIYVDYSNTRNPLSNNISTLRLNGPYGIAIDRNDNLFISELNESVIRKITPSGTVSIYAGVFGQRTYNGNVRKDSMHLWQPAGIKIDDIGNIYVADLRHHVVRFISPLGHTSTIGIPNTTGDRIGNYGQTLFDMPRSLAIDKAGFVYVADKRETIKKINPFNKTVSIYAVVNEDGEKAIAVDLHRRMYINIKDDYTVYFVDPRDSTSSLYAGISGKEGKIDGNKLTATFEDLAGIYVNPLDESLFVVQRDRIRALSDSCGVTICEGYLAQLTANPHESYEWNNNPTQAGQSISVGTAGKYFVKVGNKLGCTFYDTIQVSVIPKPIIRVSKDTVICVGDSTIISASVLPITSNDTIQWIKNGKMLKRTTGLATNTLKVGAGVYIAEVRTGKLCYYAASVRVDSIRPTLDARAEPTDTVCQGQSVQLKLDVTTAKLPLTFAWTGEIINGPDKQNPTANPISAGPNKYTVKVTDANGCKNTDTAIVFVKPIPKIITLPDTIVCLGKTIKLETSVSGGKLPYKSQYWLPVTGLSNPNILNPEITPTSSVTYTVSVTDNDNCTARDSIKIRVAKFTVSSATSDFDTICPNTKAQFNVSVLEGSGFYSYQWTPASGLSSATIANPKAQPTASTVYSVKVKDTKNYCEETRSVSLDVLNLNVNAGSDKIACIGKSTNLLASVTGGSGSYKYQWTPQTGLSNATIANPLIANPVLGSVTYIVTVTDAGGCIDKDTVVVNTYSNPTLTISNDTLICAGVRLNLAAIVANAAQPITIEWSNNKNTQLLNGTTLTLNPQDSITYFAKATDANGCFSNIDSTKLGVIKISANVTATPNVVCPGVFSQLNANARGGFGILKYTWSPKNNLSDSTIANPKANLQETTTYNLLVKDQLGCTATGNTTISVVDLMVNAGADKQICLGSAYQLGASISGGTKPYNNVIWTPADGLNVTNVLNPTFTKNAIGKYKLQISVEDNAGCSKTDSIVLEITPAPIVDAGSDSLALCFGTATPIGGKPTAMGGAGEPYRFIWTTVNSSSGIANNTLSNPSVTADQSGYYKVLVTDVGNCTSTDSVYIKVNALPLVNINKDKPTVCLLDKVTLSIAPQIGNYNYSWKSVPDQAVVGNQNTLVVQQDGMYRGIVTNTFTQCKDSAEVSIKFTNPPSNLSLNANAQECINAPVSLVGNALGDDLVYTWTTANGKGIISNFNLPNAQYNPNERLDPVAPNFITIQLKVSNDCKADSVSKNIILNPAVIPAFKTDAKETLPGETMNFYNITDTLNKGKVSFQWNFGDGVKSTTFNASHIYGDYGNFLVMLTAKNSFNCVDTATLKVEVISSSIFYIPNVFAPSTTNAENKAVKIYGVALAPEGFSWNIYNRWGEVIYSATNPEEATNNGWNGNFKNTGEPLPIGVYTYTLKAKFADGRKIEKTGTISLIR